MNILILIGSIEGGGAERQVQYLAARLPELGDSVTIAVLGRGAHPASLHGAPVIPLRSASSWVGAVFTLRRLVRGFDVVYSWMDVANAVSAAALWLDGTPVVWGFRSGDVAPGRVSRFGFVLSKLFARSADAAISNSLNVQKFYQDAGFRPGRWHIVPNGVDTSQFYPAKDTSIPVTGPVVGLVARADRMKRHDLFLEMVKVLRTKFPKARWLLAGPGTEAPQGLVAQQLDRFGLQGQVEVLGPVADVPALLRTLDVLVCCSDSEGSSNSVLEAMASAVPVASFNVGDAKALLGGGGIVTPAETTQALVDAVSQLLEDPALRASMGQAGRNKAESTHSIEQFATNTRAVLLQCVEPA